MSEPLASPYQRRRGDATRAVLGWILLYLVLFYFAIFIWPTRYRYDRLGGTPIRWDRVTGQMQFVNFHGWQAQLPLPEDTDQ